DRGMSATTNRRLALSLGASLMGLVALWAQAPTPQPGVTLSLPEALLYALEHNPQLAVLRQQHGIAAAAVVIARTYPYNPITQSTTFNFKGSDPAVDLRPIHHTHTITLHAEVGRQRSYRKESAFAAWPRTDWEI